MATYKFKRKNFSIESGKYEGTKRTPTSLVKSALIGAGIGAGVGSVRGALLDKSQAVKGSLLGAGIGTITGLMVGWADRSIFNQRSISPKGYMTALDIVRVLDEESGSDVGKSQESMTVTETDQYGRTIQHTNVNKRTTRSADGISYAVDGDPKKFDVGILVRGNVLVMYTNSLSKSELRYVSDILDDFCRRFKHVNYVSEKVKGDYVVEVNLVTESMSYLIVEEIMLHGLTVNILTGRKK